MGTRAFIAQCLAPMALDLLTVNDKVGEYPKSWYSAITPMHELRPLLAGDDNQFDICIIGAGYTGLSSALHLAKRGFKVCIIEANRVGWGASGRNGGQVGSGQRQDQDFLETHYGLENAKALWQLAQEAKQLVRNLIEENSIDCDPVDGIIEADHKSSFTKYTHNYVEKLIKDYDYDQITPLSKEEIHHLIKSRAYHSGAIDIGAFHINPLSFSLGLAKACEASGVKIFEKSKVTEIIGGKRPKTKTDNATVNSDFVVLACNGYLGDLEKNVAARVLPINNFIIATKPLGIEKQKTVMETKAAVADSKFVINYFRLSQSKTDNSARMIFGGGENYGYHFPKDIKNFVRKPMLKIFPQLADIEIEYGWGGTLAITMKRMPHFTRTAGNILSCSGYSGHGISIATLAGKLVSEAIAGHAERFDFMQNLNAKPFPGGPRFKDPMMRLAMTWFGLRDRFF